MPPVSGIPLFLPSDKKRPWVVGVDIRVVDAAQAWREVGEDTVGRGSQQLFYLFNAVLKCNIPLKKGDILFF